MMFGVSRSKATDQEPALPRCSAHGHTVTWGKLLEGVVARKSDREYYSARVVDVDKYTLLGALLGA